MTENILSVTSNHLLQTVGNERNSDYTRAEDKIIFADELFCCFFSHSLFLLIHFFSKFTTQTINNPH